MLPNRADRDIAWSELKEDAAFKELRAILRRGLYESDSLVLHELRGVVGGDKAAVREAIDDALDSFGEGVQRTAARRLFRTTEDTRHLEGLDLARSAAIDALDNEHIREPVTLRRPPRSDDDSGGWEWRVLRAIWKHLHARSAAEVAEALQRTTGEPGPDSHLRRMARTWRASLEVDPEWALSQAPGREREFESAIQAIAAGRNLVMRGAPGLGKTTLLHALYGTCPEGIYVRLEQGGEPLRDLRLALHRHIGGEFPIDDDQGIALIANAFADGALLLVDNADEPGSAEAICRLSGHVPTLTFMVTSRGQSFPGFEVLDLPPLDRTASEEVLTEFELTAEARELVLQRGAGNPLVLKQAASAAVEGRGLDDDDRLRSVLSRFDGDERRLLLLIGEMPSAFVPLGLLTNVGYLTPRGLDLLRRNAVAVAVDGGYEFHETLQAACRDRLALVQARDLESLRENAAGFYVGWLRDRPALAAIDRVLPDLMHLLEVAPKHEIRAELALALIGDRLDDPVGYIPSRGLSELLREQLEPLRAAAAEVGGAPGAKLEKNLGLFCHWADDPAAEELVLSARSRFRGAEDDEGCAGATWVLGIIADDSCNYERAEALYREPLTWLEKPAARAVGHHLVGCSLYHQGRYDEARTAFRRATASSDHPLLAARSGRRLAFVELAAGDARRAIDHLEEAREVAAALNRPRDLARIDRHVGEAHLRLGNLELASDRFEQAKALFERVGDRRGLGATLLGLATTRRLQGHLGAAADLVERSEQIARGRDPSPAAKVVSPIGVARAAEEKSRIARAVGNEDRAIRELRRSCNVYETIGHARSDALAVELGGERDARIPRPDGILFDLVDTIAETSQAGYEAVKLEISRGLGVDHDRFKAAWARSRRQASTDADWWPRDRIEWVARQLGVEASDELLDAMAQKERQLWTTSVQLKPGALEVLERIGAAGIKMALVSNGTSAMRGLPEILGLGRVLSATIVSSSVGVLKPYPGIYEQALEALRLPPGRCLYVGDGSDRELEGAQSVGLFAVRMLAGPKPAYSTKHSITWDATVRSLEGLANHLRL